MVEPLRHRQTKGAETDMPGLPPLRYTSTLPALRRHSRRLSRDTRNELWSRLKLQEPVERHTHSRTEYCRAEAGADGLRQSDRVGLGRGDEPSAGGREILLRRNGSAEFASTPIAPRRALEHLRVVPPSL